MYLFWNIIHLVIFHSFIQVAKAFKPPSGLQAIVTSPNDIIVKWTEHKRRKFRNDTFYILRYRQMQSSVPFTLVDSEVPFYAVDDAIPNTTYAFGVKFVKGKRRSRWSATVRNTTMALSEVELQPVLKPRALKLKSLTPRIVKIKWRRPKEMKRSEINGYRVVWTNSRTQQQRGANITKRSYVIAGLKPNSTYIITVETISEDGRMSNSSRVRFQTQSSVVSQSPSNVSVFPVGTTKIKLRWRKPSDELVTGYKIQYKRRGVRRGDMCSVNLSVKREEYTITDLLKDEKYKIRIAAKTNERTGPYTPWFIVDLEQYRKERKQQKEALENSTSNQSAVNNTWDEWLKVIATPLQSALNITWPEMNEDNYYYKFKVMKGDTTVVSLEVDPEDYNYFIIDGLDSSTTYNLSVKLLAESGNTLIRQVMQFTTLDFLHVMIMKTTNRPDRITLSCIVTGKPRPYIEWKKGDKSVILLPASAGKYTLIAKDVSETSILLNLTVSDLSISDSGSYTCAATNNRTTERQTFKLVVTEEHLVEDPLESVGVTIVSPFELILHIFPYTKYINRTIKYFVTYNTGKPVDDFGINTTDTHVRILDLHPDTLYTFGVLAIGYRGARKLTMNARTPDIEIDLDKNDIIVEPMNSTAMMVTWNIEDVSYRKYVHYSVLYMLNDQWETVTVDKGKSVILAGLDPNRRYSIVLQLEFPRGETYLSPVVNGSTLPEPVTTDGHRPPSPPADVFLHVQNASLKVTWLAPHPEYLSRVLWYNVVVFRGTKKVEMIHLTKDVRTATVYPIDESSPYMVQVTAQNSYGESEPVKRAYTPYITTDTSREIGGNSSVQTLTATPLSPTSVRVQWSHINSDKLTRYLVRYRPNLEVGLNSADIIDQWVSRTHNEYVIQQLQPDEEYLVSVIPYLNDVNGNTSTVYFRTLTDVPPVPPGNISVSMNGTNAIVSWDPPLVNYPNAPLTGYVVFYRNMGASFAETIILNASQTQYTVRGLVNGVVYQVAIAASNRNGTGTLSRWLLVQTLTTPSNGAVTKPPALPENVVAESHVFGVRLSWQPPSVDSVPVDGYVVGYGRFLLDVYRETVPREQRDYVITGLKHGKTYIITLRSFNVFGESRPVIRKVKAGKKRKIDVQKIPTNNNVTDNENVDDAPFDIEITESGSEIMELRISWSIPDSVNKTIAGYILYYSTTNNFTINNSVFLEKTYTTLRNLVYNTTYQFCVQIQYEDSHGKLSGVVSFTTKPAEKTEPILPKPIITNIVTGKDNVNITWTQPVLHATDVMLRGFILGYGTVIANEKQDILPNSAVSYNITGLSPNTTYFLSLRMFNEIGHGEQLFVNATTRV